MAVTGARLTTITFSVDIQAANSFSAASNAASPAQIEVKQLPAATDVTITPPTTGVTAKACTIIPPAANVATITLKGIAGDTGVVLHPTDYSQIALNSPSATFVLRASALIDGLRLIWT